MQGADTDSDSRHPAARTAAALDSRLRIRVRVRPWVRAGPAGSAPAWGPYRAAARLSRSSLCRRSHAAPHETHRRPLSWAALPGAATPHARRRRRRRRCRRAVAAADAAPADGRGLPARRRRSMAARSVHGSRRRRRPGRSRSEYGGGGWYRPAAGSTRLSKGGLSP
jgi:hypothetical protein